MLNRLAMDTAVEAGPEMVSPTYVPDLAHVAFDLLIDAADGLWHLTNPGALSRHGFVRRVAEKAGLDPAAVAALPGDAGFNRALTSERGVLLPPLDSAIDRYVRECEFPWDESDVPAVAAE
jgi:dTDP-4-dehydrorhamnose reductase